MNILSTLRPFVVAEESVAGQGEDAYTVGVRDDGICYLGVFDGCGGLGSRRYPLCQNHTGAWVASKMAACVTETFLCSGSFQLIEESFRQLEEKISTEFQRVRQKCAQETGVQVGGSLSRSFPTTISLIVVESKESDRFLCEFLWAGDSRGFLLDQDGLCQITLDDINSNADDAFWNLREDGRLTNVVNGDVPFTLHNRRIEVDDPVMLIAATDGGFNYFPTPMDFEYLLLDTLISTDTPDLWMKQICGRLKKVAGDDYTIAIACFGFSDYSELKRYYYDRWKILRQTYIDAEQGASEEQLQKLWMDYKSSYYRWS